MQGKTNKMQGKVHGFEKNQWLPCSSQITINSNLVFQAKCSLKNISTSQSLIQWSNTPQASTSTLDQKQPTLKVLAQKLKLQPIASKLKFKVSNNLVLHANSNSKAPLASPFRRA
jgi:hypothetical protein